jgi:hypothetical protein
MGKLPFYEIDTIEILEYRPKDHGTARPTEVHLHVHPVGASDGATLVMRLKTKFTAEKIVTVLQQKIKKVWG